jgi:hypothetical protein
MGMRLRGVGNGVLERDLFSEISFPSPIESCFDKVISIGWYDGTTSGVALASRHLSAFRFDLVDWGPGQDLRIFALSPFSVSDFEEVASLHSRLETPKWPVWYPRWPSEVAMQRCMGLELDAILQRASSPEYVLASESDFKTILAMEPLTLESRALLPPEFDVYPNGGFDHWQKYLRLSEKHES